MEEQPCRHAADAAQNRAAGLRPKQRKGESPLTLGWTPAQRLARGKPTTRRAATRSARIALDPAVADLARSVTSCRFSRQMPLTSRRVCGRWAASRSGRRYLLPFLAPTAASREVAMPARLIAGHARSPREAGAAPGGDARRPGGSGAKGGRDARRCL